MFRTNDLASHSSTRQLRVAGYHETSLNEHAENAVNGGKMLVQDWHIRDLFVTTLLQFITNGMGSTSVQGWAEATSMQAD